MGTATGLVDRLFWDRHANPTNVWLAISLYPVVVLAVYRRSGRLLGLVGCVLVTGLGLADPPTTDEAWATRVVQGERLWLDRGLRSEPGIVAVLAVGAAVQFGTFGAALARSRRHTVVGTVASLGMMGLFFDRVAALYDRYSCSGR